MKQLPKLRPNGWDIIVVLLVILLAVICGVTVWGQTDQSEELTVVISVDGEELQRFALEEEPDFETRIHGSNDCDLDVNVVSNGSALGIQVNASTCPTQDCVHTGTITRAGQSIVCLPGRVIIALEGTATDNDGPDVVIG